MIITIDGPAGSGKSCIAKRLAKELNFEFFDTGAIYRSVTWFLIDNHVDLNDESAIKKSLKSFVFDIQGINSEERKYLVNNQDVTKAIRSRDITDKVSFVSTYGIVRNHVLEIQRSYGRKNNTIFEGRDMGTVVFPYADVKFFLTAEPKVRAERRYLELIDKFPEFASTYDYNQILADILKRDEMDSTRKLSPLKKDKEAYLIDTSNLSVNQVVEKLIKKVQKYNRRKSIARPYFFKMRPFYSIILMLCWLLCKVFYRLKVYGITNFIKGPAIIASNHSSYYDPVVVPASSMEEVHFLAKEYLFRNPFLGKLIRKLNAHPVSQGVSDAFSFKKILKLLSEGKKVILFPEGKRSESGQLGKIMPGIGLLIYLSKCAIIPSYIHGAYEIWNRRRKRPKLFGKIRVVFGTPITFAKFENLDKQECIDHVSKEIENSLLNLQAWCEGGFKGSPP